MFASLSTGIAPVLRANRSLVGVMSSSSRWAGVSALSSGVSWMTRSGLSAATSERSSIRCIKKPNMTDALKARDGKDVEDAVRWALAEGKTLEVAGRGTKRALGRPSQSDLTLDLSGLAGVTLYEPEELVLSAKAGTPLAEIEALVESKSQQLAFEPMDYGPILGVSADSGSIGGALAANLSGPRRIKAGAARDHFLGFSAVSGRGETFKSGGRVVKNVTGYDLCKLLAGSYGTLAAMTEVTIKTLPAPETEATVLVLGLDDAQANAAMSAAMGCLLRRIGGGASAAQHGDALCRSLRGQGRDRVPARRLCAIGEASHRRAGCVAAARSDRPN